LKQLWKSFLFHQFQKAESQKPKAGSNQLSKMNYGKAAASKKAPSKSSPFCWSFGVGGQKPKPKVQPNRAIVLAARRLRKNENTNSIEPSS